MAKTKLPAADKSGKEFTAADFRAALMKIMPGYQWTVHRASKGAVRMTATGIKSSGFNRLSTLRVERSTARGMPWYTAKSAGYGTHARFLHENGDVTLAKALRGLQEHYERMANTYRGHANHLQNARAQDQVPLGAAAIRGQPADRRIPDHTNG